MVEDKAEEMALGNGWTALRCLDNNNNSNNNNNNNDNSNNNNNNMLRIKFNNEAWLS